MSKTYTLELTAEDLKDLPGTNLTAWGAIYRKLQGVAERAAADREQAELRLPWRAHNDGLAANDPRSWLVSNAGHDVTWRTERAAKLMSAAPELLEAVKLVNEFFTGKHGRGCVCGCPVIDGHTGDCLIGRALRKVATGIPE